MFSERLKLARKRSGLSLRELSSNMNGMVSAQAIGKYERGEMMPSSSVAIALADALDVTTTYLLSPTVVSLESVEFRKLASTKVRERAMVEATVLDHVDRYLQVEELLDITSSIWEVPDGAPYHAETVEEGELTAARVRKAWNLGGGSIPNMAELLEEHGIKVLKLDFPRVVDGLTCFVHRTEDTAVPVVVCSTGKSIERQRFTLAHELGHLVMDIPAGMPEEKICDRFASALLVPENELVREVGRRRLDFGFGELVEIKKTFGVSAAALVIRMRDFGHHRRSNGNANIPRHRAVLEDAGTLSARPARKPQTFPAPLPESTGGGRDIGIQSRRTTGYAGQRNRACNGGNGRLIRHADPRQRQFSADRVLQARPA